MDKQLLNENSNFEWILNRKYIEMQCCTVRNVFIKINEEAKYSKFRVSKMLNAFL